MRFELLLVPNCPHEAEAAALFRSALAAAGQSTLFSPVVVADLDTAKRLNFTGSPSFFAGHHDLLPDHREPAIACRLYTTTRGLSGLPDLDSLVDALQTAAGTGA